MPSPPEAPTAASGIDVYKCLRMGCIGALGAIPGTVAAHPCDVIKIRMQTSTLAQGETYRRAVTSVLAYSTGAGSAGGAAAGGAAKVASSWRLAGFYRGLVPAVEQRCVARGPMFLLSELYTQLVESKLGLTGTEARFVGSVGSGYSTGFLAGLAEYRKKLLSQSVVRPSEARWGALVGAASKSGNLRSLFLRLNAAGTCSAAYDSVFFASQHELHVNRGVALPASYGMAAAAAVCCSFVLDTAVARMMIVRPDEPVRQFRQVVRSVLSGPGSGFRGIGARGLEFTVSYTITGLVASGIGVLAASYGGG